MRMFTGLLIAFAVLTVLILYSALTVPLDEYDRRIDDEEQMKFLRERKK